MKQAQLRELSEALEQALQSLAAAGTAAPEKRFTVETDGRIRFIPVADIQSAVACRNNVVLHTNAEAHVLRSTLQRLQEQLGGLPFLRIERSILLNMRLVVEMQTAPNRKFRFRTHNGRWHVSGASYFDDVVAYLERCDALVEARWRRVRRGRPPASTPTPLGPPLAPLSRTAAGT